MGVLNVQRLAARVPSPACMGEGMVRAYSDIRAYSYILSFPRKRDEPNPDEPLTVPPCYVYICIRGSRPGRIEQLCFVQRLAAFCHPQPLWGRGWFSL